MRRRRLWPRILRHRARPLSSGRSSSVRTSHGRRATASRTASAPVEASNTEKPWRARSSATRASVGVVRIHDQGGAQRDGRAVERPRSCGLRRLAPRFSARVDGPRGRRGPSGRGRVPEVTSVDCVEALDEPVRLPRPGEELHDGEAARRGRLRGQVVHSQRHDREAGRGGIDVQGAQHRVPIRQGRGQAAEGGVPAPTLPLGNRLEAAEAKVDQDEVHGRHRGHPGGRGGVLRHEDPVVLSTQDALGGEAVDRVRFEDHDTPCIRQRSLPTLMRLRCRAPGGWGEGCLARGEAPNRRAMSPGRMSLGPE